MPTALYQLDANPEGTTTGRLAARCICAGRFLLRSFSIGFDETTLPERFLLRLGGFVMKRGRP